MISTNAKEIDLEGLDYPMFKTTIVEKYYLKKALCMKNPTYYLCLRLSSLKSPTRLLDKIKIALCQDSTLSGYLEFPHHFIYGEQTIETILIELRNVWIRKLLEYKGD